MKITVANIRYYGRPRLPNEVYIGRRNVTYRMEESPLHNLPEFSRYGRYGSIAKFKEYFEKVMEEGRFSPIIGEMQRLTDLIRKYDKLVLICWCAPLACHGDVIKEYLETRIFNKEV